MLRECQQVRPELIRGVYPLITSTGLELALWRAGDLVVVSDGVKREVVRLAPTPTEVAAQFAAAFDGVVVRGDSEAILQAIGGAI